MKTQVIHLEVHDDLISIHDRMVWAKTPRILLVWPRRGRVDVSPLDLTLLRRHAESLGAQLGLVTRSGEMRAAAREKGISFFSTTTAAQKNKWLDRQTLRITRRNPPRNMREIRQQLPSVELFSFIANPIRRVVVFTAGVLAVLVVVLVFLPSAAIQITMPDQQQSLTIDVNVAPGEQSVQISGSIPQHSLTLVMDGTDTARASGQIILPDQVARGEVVLMNLTDKLIKVPSGTVLQTPSAVPVFFLTEQSVEILAGKGKTARVAIHARIAGLSGNVLPGEITTFEGPLKATLAVNNLTATMGGTEVHSAIALPQDRDNLKKRLLAELERQARLGLNGQVSAGDVPLPETLAQTKILEEVFIPPAGEAGDKLSLSMRVEYTLGYASLTDLHLLASQALDTSLQPGFVVLPGQIRLIMLSAPTQSAGVIRWQMHAERSIHPELNVQDIISIIQGKPVSQAVNLLTNAYGLEKGPQITIRPAWWPWLPFLPVRIAVAG
jgi:hypothetical protein